MGLGYGSVASARSALGNFITVPGFPKLVDHPLVQKLLMFGHPNHVTRGYGIPPSSLNTWLLWPMRYWISNTCVGRPLPFWQYFWGSGWAQYTSSNSTTCSSLIQLLSLTLLCLSNSWNPVVSLGQLSFINIPTMNSYALCGLSRHTWNSENPSVVTMMPSFSPTGDPINLILRIP